MAKFISTGDIDRKLTLKRNKFLEMIRKYPGISRQSIAETLRISTFNISHLTRSLIAENIIIENDDLNGEPQGQGRPSKPLVLNGDFDYFAGIDLEATCWRMVILNFEGKVVFEHREEFVERNQREGYIEQLDLYLRTGIKAAGPLWKKVSKLGFGAPGSLNLETGTILRFQVLKNFSNIPIKSLYEKISKKDVVLSDNISNLAVYDQWTRPTSSQKSILHFAIRSGIRTVLVNNDELYLGKNHYSGEIGFFPLDFSNPDGFDLHSALAQKSLKQKLKFAPSEFWNGNAEAVKEVYAEKESLPTLQLFTTAFSAALKSMVYLYDPDEIMVHSSLFKEPNLLWENLEKEFMHQMRERTFAAPPLIVSTAPANSAAVGAGIRALANHYPTS